MLGVKAEQELAKIVEASSTLEKLGVHFESLNARIRVQDKLQKNYDKRELIEQLCVSFRTFVTCFLHFQTSCFYNYISTTLHC